ncbi:MAG: hypothetical protein LBL99_01405 [Holosporaceae bacterium]|nr:hypothetical protein [Holosporaceae bacterium]
MKKKVKLCFLSCVLCVGFNQTFAASGLAPIYRSAARFFSSVALSPQSISTLRDSFSTIMLPESYNDLIFSLKIHKPNDVNRQLLQHAPEVRFPLPESYSDLISDLLNPSGSAATTPYLTHAQAAELAERGARDWLRGVSTLNFLKGFDD